MLKYPLLALIPFLLSCTAGISADLSATYNNGGTFLRNQVHSNTALMRYIDTHRVRFQQEHTLRPFRLTERELLTMETDLNSDGNKDIIGTVDNFKFEEYGGYPLYLLIKDEYSYHRIKTDARTAMFNIEVLGTASNGYKDISVDGNVIRFDGEIYR